MTERLRSDEMWEQSEQPTAQQLNDYVELIQKISHSVGKGVKRLRKSRQIGGELVTDISPKEFWIPGSLTGWSIPDRKLRISQERARQYSASYLAHELGEGAAQLVVLEMDSNRFLGHDQRPKYHTLRNTYLINWTLDGVVTNATMVRGEYVSAVQVDADIRGTEIDEAKLWMDHEETDPDLFRAFERDVVSQVEFDGLLRRTDEYGKDFIAQVEANRKAVA